MYNWDVQQFRPPAQVLAQCHRIVADDSQHVWRDIRNWARYECSSCVWIDVNSNGHDGIQGTFWFGNPAEATMFSLRWL